VRQLINKNTEVNMNEPNTLNDPYLWMPRQIALDVLAHNIQKMLKWSKEQNLDTTALLVLDNAYRQSSKTYNKASDKFKNQLIGGK
jgi:hypothetical protein